MRALAHYGLLATLDCVSLRGDGPQGSGRSQGRPRQCPRNSAREPAIEVPGARPRGEQKLSFPIERRRGNLFNQCWGNQSVDPTCR